MHTTICSTELAYHSFIQNFPVGVGKIMCMESRPEEGGGWYAPPEHF